jgi:hypothetical protein
MSSDEHDPLSLSTRAELQNFWGLNLRTLDDAWEKLKTTYVHLIGNSEQGVLCAEAAPLWIGAKTGRGKSFLLQQLIRCLFFPEQYPKWMGRFSVYPLRPDERILLLTLDRGRQMLTRLKGSVNDQQREELGRRIISVNVNDLFGRNLQTYPTMLADMALTFNTRWVLIDGIDKLVGDIVSNEGGRAIADGVNYTVEAGVAMVATMHIKKDQKTMKFDGSEVDHFFGSSQLTNVAGSIVSLSSDKAISDVVTFQQIKNIEGSKTLQGTLRHDLETGNSYYLSSNFLEAIHQMKGSATTRAIAMATDPEFTGDTKSTWGKLEKYVKDGTLEKIPGTGGKGSGADGNTYRLTASALQQHFPDSVESTSEPSSDAVSADVTPLSDLDKSISDALSGKGAVAVQN